MTISKFKDKLDNTPHLMTPESFVHTAEFLSTLTPLSMSECEDDCEEYSDCNYNEDTGVGTIFVSGALTYETEWWQQYFGGCSYESIKEQTKSLINKGMSTLVIIGNSGGGEAYACLETSSYLRYLADDNNFKIIWYVDGMAASACYGLACSADEIIANPMGEVGSIGVVVRLRNYNEAMKKAGVEDTYIHYGSAKIPYDKNGNWNKDFIDRVQESVDSLGEEFTSFVAENRDIPVEDIKATQAAVYSAKKALEIGLIDSVKTHEEFYTYLADYVQKEKNPQMLKNTLFKFTSEQEKIEMKELDDAKLQLDNLKAEMEAEVAVKVALSAEVTSLKASLETIKTQLASFETEATKLQAEKDAADKAALDAKVAYRKTQLTAVMPANEVDEAYKTLADASDKIFEFAVAGYKAKEESKTSNPLFKELGNEGDNAVEAFDPVKAQAEYNKKHYGK